MDEDLTDGVERFMAGASDGPPPEDAQRTPTEWFEWPCPKQAMPLVKVETQITRDHETGTFGVILGVFTISSASFCSMPAAQAAQLGVALLNHARQAEHSSGKGLITPPGAGTKIVVPGAG